MLCLCFSTVVQAKEILTIAVASSLYPAMQKQVANFEKHHHVTVRLISGSTGRLYNQIIQGAPFDLFVAADQERPALLVSQGKAVSQYDLGRGYLGIMAGNRIIADSGDLIGPAIRHIAIANPDVAPFGSVTREVLQKQGLWSSLKHKFVYAQNAMQATMMVKEGLVDAGFVPVMSSHESMATIHYQGVILTKKASALLWIQTFGSEQNL